MEDSEFKTDTENEHHSELDTEDKSEEGDNYSEDYNFGAESGSKNVREKKKNRCEKGPPIVCLMCKSVWTKSRKGGRLFMFGGTRPFMAKFEAKFNALMGHEDLSALQKKSATKFGKSYICRECYLMVRQTYDNIRKLQRDVCKSIQKAKSIEDHGSLPTDQSDSGSDQDLEIDPQAALNTPKKRLPPVAERIAEKIAKLTFVKINNKVPVIVLKVCDLQIKNEHYNNSEETESEDSNSETRTSSSYIINKIMADNNKSQDNLSSQSKNNHKIIMTKEKELQNRVSDKSVINLEVTKSLKQKSYVLPQGNKSCSDGEQSCRSQTENVYSSKEAAECSAISLNTDTSFASQHLLNDSSSIEAHNVTNCKAIKIELTSEHVGCDDTNSLDSSPKHKPSPDELAEILANPLLLIKSSQPIKLAEVKNNNVYICGEDGCDWIFSSKFFWENHIRHYHRCGKPFVCPFEGCDRSFTGKSKLELHVRSHTDERPFICDKCGSGFRGNQELRAHRLTHTSEKPHQCPKCDKNFKLLSSLKRHLQFHDGGEFPFPCTYPECEKAFKSRYDLKCHYRLHTGEKPYKCPEPGCGMAFRIPCQFTMHKRSHTGEKPFKCTEDGCSAAYISSNALQAHMLSHTSVRPFCCEFCGKTFKHKMLYRMHLKKHSGSQGFRCPVESCGEEYADRKTLDQHMVTNHGIQNYKQQSKKVFVCPEVGCGLKYSTDGSLHCHSLKVHKKGNIECKEELHTRKLICPYDKCHREYEDSNSLQDHLSKAHIPMPREKMCPLCGQAFPYMELLEQHRQSVHNESSMLNEQMKGIFVCNSERCGVHFNKLEDLKHHVNWHLGYPPYRCELEECGRTFLLETMLISHSLEHENLKPFTCSFDHCHEGFTSHIEVLKHSKIHYGFFRCPIDGCSKAMQTLSSARIHLQHHEKPYVCVLCGKRFISSPHWMKHKRSHTGEKVYECKVCSCQFADSESLKSHKQVHKGEKQYKCEECGQRFGSQVSAKNHMKMHSRELPFVCPEEGCGKAFRENGSLKAHMNVHSKPSHLCTQCGKVYKFSVSKHRCKVEPEEQISSAQTVKYMQLQQPLQHVESSHISSMPPPPPSQSSSAAQVLSQSVLQSISQSLPQTISQTIIPSVSQTVPLTVFQNVSQIVPKTIPSISQNIPQPLTQSLPQPLPQSLTQSLSHSLPQSLTQSSSQSLPHSLTQSIPASLSQSLSQTLSQALPQHPSSQQYMNNVMMSELPPQSYVMEVEEAARAMRQNFGATDTIVVDPPYYNYIILYDRPVQQ